jgi:hypothetical protein
MSVLTGATRRNVPEDGILQGHESFYIRVGNWIYNIRFEVFTAVTRMPSSGMLRHVALVRSGVSEEPSTSFIRVTRIGDLGTALAITRNRRMHECILSFVEVTREGYGLVIRFIYFLHVAITINTTTIVISYTLQFTTECSKSHPASVFSTVLW